MAEDKSNSNILYWTAGITGLAVGVTWYMVYYFDKCQLAKNFFIKMGSIINSEKQEIILGLVITVSVIIGISLLGKGIEFCCSEAQEPRKEVSPII